MMDLGGDVMIESSRKINSRAEAPNPCNSAALQWRQHHTLQQQIADGWDSLPMDWSLDWIQPSHTYL
jgi:hypothetical protein